MKGMNKIIRGYTFKSVLLYCEGRGDKKHQVDGSGDLPDGRLIGGNMAGRNVQQLMHEFIVARKLRPDIEKATWHNSLRLPPGDKISDEKWGEIALDYIKRMGFSDSHMYCVWKHDDEEGVHIVACRIGLDGSVFLGKNENLQSTMVIQGLEKTHGLRITKGPDYDPDSGKLAMPDVRKLKKAEIEKAVRTGKEPPKLILQRLIDEALVDSPTLLQLVERLDSAGVEVRANLASTGTFNGLSFEIDGIAFKGSALGKSYSWKGLQGQGVTYEQARDGPGLQRFRPATSSDQDGGGAASADPGPGQHVGGQQSADPNANPDTGTSAVPGRGIEKGSQPESHEFGSASRDFGAQTSRSGDSDRPAVDRHGRDSGATSIPASDSIEAAIADEPAARSHRKGRDSAEALTADHLAKIDAWRHQHEALQSPFYRLTLVGRTGKAAEKIINLGKTKDEERFYTAADVEQKIPLLRFRNVTGFDIYVTPIDSSHHYMVVDDMTTTTLDALKAAGYTPCLVQQSSAGNMQAVIKTPRDDGKNEQTHANKVVQQLNQKFGDPKFSGVVHPFRMAGFSNKKPDKLSSFTQILEAGHRLCVKAGQFLDGIRQATRDLFAQRPSPAPSPKSTVKTTDSTDDSDIYKGMPEQDLSVESPTKAFQRAAWGVRGWVKANGLIADDSRIDFRAAVIMLKAGWSPEETEEAMLMGSGGLSERHSNVGDYVSRTVKKASMEVGASAASAKTGPKAK